MPEEKNQQTLKDYGSPDDYGTRERQAHLLMLLKAFHRLCIDNGIEYSLSSGTLLGAIRHGGFIPWDDDADVMLTRDNYTRFLSVAKKCTEFNLVRDIWIHRVRENDERTPAMIDVFVVDNVPDKRVIRLMKLFIVRTLQGTMKGPVDYSKYSLPYKACIFITRALGRLMSDDVKFDLYQKASTIGNAHKTEHLGIYNNLYRALPRMYDADMMDSVHAIPFEDTQLLVSDGYDRYLRQVYGDYMTPPALGDRQSGDYEMVVNNQVLVNNSKHI